MNTWLVKWHVPILGDIAISTYFACLVLGLVLALHVCVREAKRSGEDPLLFFRLGLIGIGCGLIGGRLGHVLLARPDIYLENPVRVLEFWRGGMVFYGGAIGGAIGVLLACRRYKVNLLRACDICAAPLMLGLALGRLGCLSAGCCFGRPIDWPWGIEWPWAVTFLSGQVPSPLRGIPLHPTQAYAAFNALALFVLLIEVRRRQRYAGQVTGVLLVAYGLSRSIIELFRLDLERGFVFEQWLGQVLSTSQAVSIPMVLAGIVLLVRGSRSHGSDHPSSPS